MICIMLFQTYVQDLILAEASEIYKLLVLEKGHFYVCGDCTMAEHVFQTLKTIIQRYGNMSDKQLEAYMLLMRVSLHTRFVTLKRLEDVGKQPSQ